MGAGDNFSPFTPELDKYGMPTGPRKPARPNRPLLLAAFCLACASVPPAVLLGIWKYHHLRRELRLEAIGAGLVIIVPWFLLMRFGPRGDFRGAWCLVVFLVTACTLAATFLFGSGLIGYVCHQHCLNHGSSGGGGGF